MNSTQTVDLAKTLDILYNLESSHLEAKIKDSKILKIIRYTAKPQASHQEAKIKDNKILKTIRYTAKSQASHLEAKIKDSKI